VGPKKAKTLLERFGTLEEVLAHADEAPGAKLRENLKNFADQAYLSRRLVTLNTRLPLDVDWEAARVHEPDRGRLLKLFADFGFRRFAEEMRQPGPDESTVEETKRTWEIVDTTDKFFGFLDTLKQQHKFCLKLETTSLNAMQAEIVGWAFSWQAGTGYYLPVEGPPGQTTLDRAAVLEALRPILENPDIQVINHNIKYDLIVLRRSNVQLAGLGVDPMVGDYLLDAGARDHKLDNLAARSLNQRTTAVNELDDGDKTAMIEIDPGKAAEFAVADADVAWQVAEKISEELQRENLWDLYWNLERPLIPVLADMEFAGIRVDVDELSRQSEQVAGRLDQLIEQIHGLAGHEFNIDSPKQLSVVLFDELNLPVLKKIKTGASTNQDVLEKLAAMHPLPALITEHRQLSKLKGTYLDALPEQVNPETGNIHASFHQTVAATGRLSASDPNLQNIPIRTEEGRRIRKAFIPSQPGWKLVCSDYSQIELRMLAHFSGDSVLQAAFQQGADVHATVAAEIFDVDVEQVDSKMRRVAKAVNFGVIYGQTPFGLSATLDISLDDAATFIDHYFAKYARVDQYLEELLALCAQSGCATTILGRRRKITGIRAKHRGQLNFPERTAINTVIQGSAADLIKQAMIRIRARLKREAHPARMLLQIHDELMFEAPADQTDLLIEIVREEMEHAMELSVPLVVDLSIGDNWLEIESA
jgi:DNA polymerase-1